MARTTADLRDALTGPLMQMISTVIMAYGEPGLDEFEKIVKEMLEAARLARELTRRG
jgi:hypothetical protein